MHMIKYAGRNYSTCEREAFAFILALVEITGIITVYEDVKAG